MRLQIALDCNDIETALSTLANVYPYVDIAELGTGLMISEGVRAIKTLKEQYPDLILLSDVKLMDGGQPLAQMIFNAGADIVTVLGVAANETIRGGVRAAEEYGKETFVDMICVSDVETRSREIDELGARYIGVHTSYDLRDSVGAPLESLRKIKGTVNRAQTAISGGIGYEMLPEIIAEKPDIVITGGAIMNAADQRNEAKKIYNMIHG
ncbi:MAG TPA: orotidine 5'-phosphate decarboxylase [Candidatus Mediterraneibacter norfolkensis]|nr:orotidine 5'-phosphate decarboxylase [Candidatus Mediterraneibacter norfolkensis]